MIFRSLHASTLIMSCSLHSPINIIDLGIILASGIGKEKKGWKFFNHPLCS